MRFTSAVLKVITTASGTDNSLTTIVELVEQAQTEAGDRPGSPAGSPGPRIGRLVTLTSFNLAASVGVASSTGIQIKQ